MRHDRNELTTDGLSARKNGVVPHVPFGDVVLASAGLAAISDRCVDSVGEMDDLTLVPAGSTRATRSARLCACDDCLASG